ncbi:MAG TPA: isochorismatase [Blastocatellia bacterium]
MRKKSIKTISVFLAALAFLAIGLAKTMGDSARLPLRTAAHPFRGADSWVEARFEQTIVNSRTAIIITDMWDKHWCAGATERVKQIALKMEPTLNEARRAGILIIHAPSDTMNFYANEPGRLLAQNAPRSVPPPPMQFDEPPLPIDDSDEGCDTPGDKPHKAWTQQIATLTIAPGDIISDRGDEIYNVLRQRNIDTVLYMGVHTNMCILNRSFAIRQMSKWGLRCILVRDLTDAMYNPASRPYVSHASGTDLVIRHIERYWAPSVTSDELISALRASAP